jgi:cytochrome oxidase Cu insertion factor (SCO1/SenC/PrrC family)
MENTECTPAARAGAGSIVTRRAAVAAVLAGLALLTGCNNNKMQLVGSDLGNIAAPDFTLTDQTGATVRLSGEKGKAVVVCFIYTSCPNICPIIAASLHQSYIMLKPATQAKVAFLAVTVDPLRDTPDALRQFTGVHSFTGVAAWHALYGDQATLATIWSSYGIDTGTIQKEVNHDLSGGTAPLTQSHTDAIYVIDPKGKERVLLHSDFLPADMAKNLETLAN